MKLITAIIFALTIFSFAEAQKTASPSGTIKGTIFDSEPAVVPNAKVMFEADGLKRETVTDDEGNYKIELPVGVYKITTDYRSGFCHSQRAPFRVRKASDILINLTLVVCPIASITISDKNGKYIGEEDRYIDPFQSESFQITKAMDEPRDLLVRYGNRQEKESVVEYQGVRVMNGIPAGVVVSYDAITIVADKVRFNRKTLLLEASENVFVEDGKQRTAVTSAKIDFRVKNPAVEIQHK